jgi:histidine triad (HIT) family protein
MASDCIFCKIAGGEIPSKAVYRDDDVVAIEDINPQAPVHVLVMPKAHHPNLMHLTASGDRGLLCRLMETAAGLGRRLGGDGGFRLVVNTGADGGQTVDHLHVHVLAGRPMTWPPG